MTCRDGLTALPGHGQFVVNHLGAIRNKFGDAHGQGRKPIKPKARHAELAVNLAGTMAAFLVATWKERNRGMFGMRVKSSHSE